MIVKLKVYNFIKMPILVDSKHRNGKYRLMFCGHYFFCVLFCISVVNKLVLSLLIAFTRVISESI